MKNAPIQTRTAVAADAQAIVHVHFAAVHQTAAAFYPPEIIANWSREPDAERYEWIRQVIGQGEEIFIVAEDKSGIVGFGFINTKAYELKALYVHPLSGRRGIGKEILQELERRATAAHLGYLELNASLNATAFYRQNGYAPLSSGMFRLATGHEMECVKMKKTLRPLPEDVPPRPIE